MITSEHKNIAQKSMDLALKNGCSSARVSIIVANNNSFEYRNTQLDKLHRSSENKLYIELFVDGRYGSFSTNRFNESELEVFIKEGIASTRFLAEDTFRQLPDSSRYYKPGTVEDLNLSDVNYLNYSTEQKLDLVQSTVEEIYGTDDRIVSVLASYDDNRDAEYMIASNGFENEEQGTAFTLMAEVSLKTEGDARPEAYFYNSQLFWENLQKTGIAKAALTKALYKLGQTKIKSGKYSMLLDNMVSSQMLSPLISAMFGRTIQQKRSFLINKLGSKIVSSLLTVSDCPHTPKTFGSRWYDGEGVATKNQTIIERGVLNTYFIDTYNSLKMNCMPTISSPSVIKVELGEGNCEQLMEQMHKGVWVTGFNGGNTNGATGDFSFGIEGFWIENGVPAQPISEMNITGNILNLWSDLVAVGNDPFSTCSSRQIPSLLFQNVNFSGL